jgi:hypothetical protein
MNMCESNFTVEQIALTTRKIVEEVQAIINRSVLLARTDIYPYIQVPSSVSCQMYSSKVA